MEAIAHAGPLSLKTVRRGRTVYGFGHRQIAIGPGQMLLAPSSARYTTKVGEEGANLVSLYFPEHLVADAVAALALPSGRVLDGARADMDPIRDFVPHRRTAGVRMQAVLESLSRRQCQDHLGDLAMDALRLTVALALSAIGATGRAPAARSCVRRELFRRASLARDHVEQNLERDVALASLAKIACLSPFHLHRVFKAAFGETPAAMRRRRRIEQARGLLARTRRPVAEIARAVGFESESAFSRSFRALSGASPTAFRNAAGP